MGLIEISSNILRYLFRDDPVVLRIYMYSVLVSCLNFRAYIDITAAL